MKLVTLRTSELHGRWLEVIVAPELGGSIVRCALCDGVRDVEIMQRCDHNLTAGDRSMFFTVPWFARLLGGKVVWKGEELSPGLPDAQFAIHGITRRIAFDVLEVGNASVTMRSEFVSGIQGMSYLVPFTTTLSLSLSSQGDGHKLAISKSVKNDGDREAPFVMADHPFFQKRIGDEVPVLSYQANTWYPVREDALVPTGDVITECPQHENPSGPDVFQPGGWKMQPGWWEFCTSGWGGVARATWARAGIELVVRDEDGTSPYLQVWVPPDQAMTKNKLQSGGRECFGLEPLTGLADAFRLLQEGKQTHGARVLSSGESFSAATSYEVIAQ